MSPRRSRSESGGDRERPGDRRVGRRSLLRATSVGFVSLAVPPRAIAQEEEGGETDGEAGEETGGEGQGDGEGQEGDEDGEEAGEGGGTEQVIVGPGGDFVFEPEQLTIQPGTTVLWTWESDSHNVNPTEVPEGAEWEGYVEIENTGFEYEFTFDAEGEYHYVCDPHVAQGMEGDVIVGGDAEDGGGAAGPVEIVPDAATTLIVATVTSLVAILGLSYVFLKYGGVSGE